MKIALSSKFLIFSIVFINFLGYGIVFPLLPLLTIQYGGNPLVSGFFIGVFSLMQVISMPILGRLSDRYGRRPLLLFSLWGTFISFVLMGYSKSLVWLLIARVVDGISGGNLSIAQAYIADITDKRDRAQGMGIIGAAISLGFILGPLWGSFFSRISFSASFFSAAIITLASIILTQFFLPESVTEKEITYEKKHYHFGDFFRHTWSSGILGLFLTQLVLFWAQSGLYTTLSLFTHDVLHFSLSQTALLFAISGILSAFIQAYMIKKIVSIFSEENILVYGTIGSTIGMGIMAGTSSVLFFTLGVMIFSVGNSFLQPIVQALVSEKTPEHEQGGSMGLLQSFGAAGRIVGPIAAGYLYQTLGPFSPSALGLVLFFIVIIYTVRLQRISSR